MISSCAAVVWCEHIKPGVEVPLVVHAIRTFGVLPPRINMQTSPPRRIANYPSEELPDNAYLRVNIGQRYRIVVEIYVDVRSIAHFCAFSHCDTQRAARAYGPQDSRRGRQDLVLSREIEYHRRAVLTQTRTATRLVPFDGFDDARVRVGNSVVTSMTVRIVQYFVDFVESKRHATDNRIITSKVLVSKHSVLRPECNGSRTTVSHKRLIRRDIGWAQHPPPPKQESNDTWPFSDVP